MFEGLMQPMHLLVILFIALLFFGPSKLGDLGPYGKQVIQFYTQVKTVTARWFDDSTVNPGIHTTISLK